MKKSDYLYVQGLTKKTNDYGSISQANYPASEKVVSGFLSLPQEFPVNNVVTAQKALAGVKKV